MISSRSIGGWKSFVILFFHKKFFLRAEIVRKMKMTLKLKIDFILIFDDKFFIFQVYSGSWRPSSLRVWQRKFFGRESRWNCQKSFQKVITQPQSSFFSYLHQPFHPFSSYISFHCVFSHRFRSFKFLTSDQACIISISEWFHCDKIPF